GAAAPDGGTAGLRRHAAPAGPLQRAIQGTPGEGAQAVTAITKTDAQPVFTREDIAVVKATCAPEATDAELKMFLHIAKQSGLDPLRKQIHFMKYQGRVS